MVGLDRFEERHWRKLGNPLGGNPVPKTKQQRPTEQKERPSRPASKRRGDWLGDRGGNWLK